METPFPNGSELVALLVVVSTALAAVIAAILRMIGVPPIRRRDQPRGPRAPPSAPLPRSARRVRGRNTTTCPPGACRRWPRGVRG